MRVLATAVAGTVDEARERSVARGQTSPEVAERLLAAGLYDRMRATKTYQRVPPMPDLDMTMERIVAPIVVGEEIHGHLWIIAGDEPLTELDTVAIRHGSTVAALLLLTEQARRDAAAARRGDLLEDLLGVGGDPETIAEHAHHLGVRVDRPHQVLLVQAELAAGGGVRALGETLGRWAGDADRRGFTAWRQDGLAWVLEADDEQVGRDAAEQLVADLAHPGRRLLVAVGGTARPAGGEAVDLRRSYAQARRALSIARALGRAEGVVAFSDLGLLHWLDDLSTEALEENSYVARLRALDGDTQRGRELLASLEAYLDHGGKLAEAAAALPVHRNTLLHRLTRIEERCGVDLRDAMERLHVHAAVKALRLHDPGS
jgi:purine catabolism regulator